MRKMFKCWATPRRTTATLWFPSSEKDSCAPSSDDTQLRCEVHRAMLDARLAQAQICSCCKAPAEMMHLCHHKKAPLGKAEVIQTYALGDSVFRARTEDHAQLLSGGTLLMVVKRVELQTLSESLLYGEPSIVTPSSDAELEWETIKVNSQQFVALWRLLLTKNQGLLLKARGYPHAMSPLLSLFILLPNQLSADPSFLLRSVMTREQYLPPPARTLSQAESVQQKMLTEMDQHLNKVAVCDYNPLDHTSQFHEFVGRLVLANRDDAPTAPERKGQPFKPTAGPSSTRFTNRKTTTTNLVRIGDVALKSSAKSSSSARRHMTLL